MPSIEWNRRWGREFAQFLRGGPNGKKTYGHQWGDPDLRGLAYWVRRLRHPYEIPGPLYKVVDQYIRPYGTPDSVVVEIGVGGGRWTGYLNARRIVAVDINSEFFEPLQRRFPDTEFVFHQPKGYDLDVVEDESIDFVFTFGTFVHLEPEGIRQYLAEIERVLKPGAHAVVHYSDKTKLVARINRGFTDMNAAKMEAMVNMSIVEHNTRMLTHSNLIVLRK